jgi:hypothetical protein
VSGAARFEEAVAAWNACLEVTRTVWPSERVQNVETRRNEALAEIATQVGDIGAGERRLRKTSEFRRRLCHDAGRLAVGSSGDDQRLTHERIASAPDPDSKICAPHWQKQKSLL